MSTNTQQIYKPQEGSCAVTFHRFRLLHPIENHCYSCNNIRTAIRVFHSLYRLELSTNIYTNLLPSFKINFNAHGLEVQIVNRTFLKGPGPHSNLVSICIYPPQTAWLFLPYIGTFQSSVFA